MQLVMLRTMTMLRTMDADDDDDDDDDDEAPINNPNDYDRREDDGTADDETLLFT